jgi:hypothetical protein
MPLSSRNASCGAAPRSKMGAPAGYNSGVDKGPLCFHCQSVKRADSLFQKKTSDSVRGDGVVVGIAFI